MPGTDVARDASFGQQGKITAVDRAGVWLSGHQIRRTVGSLDGKAVGDFGCGYEASYMRSVLGRVKSATLVDISLADDLKSLAKVTAIEGQLPDVLTDLADQSLDVVLCMSVLEHLWEPGETLRHFRRLLRPGGVCAVNVPSWRGKRALEFSAFRLGLSPACEMDDHKTYYVPGTEVARNASSGQQGKINRCFRHKFALNTSAVFRVDSMGART